MKINFKLLTTLLFTAILHCNSLPKEPIPTKKQTIGDYSFALEKAEWQLRTLQQKNNLQGLSVVIVEDDKPLLVQAYSAKSSKEQVSTKTKFYLGSVSKVFTALLIFKLVEEKKISLDRPITDYLKNLKLIPRNAGDSPPTIRQILSHHSGLPSDIQNGLLLNLKEDSTFSDSYFLKLASGEYRMAQSPGKVMAYSNFGFSLLGSIIEIISKKSLEEFAKEKIFLPLEMKDTSFLYSPNDKRFTKGYKGSKETDLLYIRDLPAGSLSSTAEDMTNFLQMFLNEGVFKGKKVFANSSLLQMRQPQKASLYDFDFKIGMPFWFLNKFTDTMQMVGHGGDVPPFHAYFGIDAFHKIGIVIMTNTYSSSASLEQTSYSILSDLFEVKTGRKASPKLQGLKNKTFTKTDFSKWEGKYLTPLGWTEVTAKENWLATNDPIVYRPWKENEFTYEIRLLFHLIPIPLDVLKDYRVKFTIGEQGEKVLALTLMDKFLIMYGLETEPKEVSETWKNRVGKYRVLNPKKSLFRDFNIQYKSKENLMYLHYTIDLVQSFPAYSAIEVMNDEVGYLAGLGRNQGDALVWKMENNKEILEFSGFQLEKIK
jgi:CubicO group peptidase (beta-lactamase class C family)